MLNLSDREWTQAILQKIKLNDIKGIYDLNSMAQRRQEEIIEEMIAKSEQGTAEYIEPRELEEHKGMLDAAYKYIMTRRFYQLSNDVKLLDSLAKNIKEQKGVNGLAELFTSSGEGGFDGLMKAVQGTGLENRAERIIKDYKKMRDDREPAKKKK